MHRRNVWKLATAGKVQNKENLKSFFDGREATLDVNARSAYNSLRSMNPTSTKQQCLPTRASRMSLAKPSFLFNIPLPDDRAPFI